MTHLPPAIYAETKKKVVDENEEICLYLNVTSFQLWLRQL